MEKTYRLSFNENQQTLHLDNFTQEEGTQGWVTIFEYCTELEFKVFEAYVNRVPKELTKEYLLECGAEVKVFMKNILEAGLVIGRF